MLTSVEVRWFLPESIPQDIRDWFLGEALTGELTPTQNREDLYLDLGDREDVGIKWREGNLEVKWRQSELGSRAFGEVWQGQMERWLKWSCEAETPNGFVENAIASRRWISIQKVRQQRQSKYAEGNCAVELSQLQIEQQTWWSLAFEATGNNDCLELILEQTLEQIQQRDRPISSFTLKNSYAYPRFLTQF